MFQGYRKWESSDIYSNERGRSLGVNMTNILTQGLLRREWDSAQTELNIVLKNMMKL